MKEFVSFRQLFFYQKMYQLLKYSSGKHREVAAIIIFTHIFQAQVVTTCNETLAPLYVFPSLFLVYPQILNIFSKFSKFHILVNAPFNFIHSTNCSTKIIRYCMPGTLLGTELTKVEVALNSSMCNSYLFHPHLNVKLLEGKGMTFLAG